MTPLIIDTEVSGAINGTKGNPFSDGNRLILVGTRIHGSNDLVWVDVDQRPYGKAVEQIRRKGSRDSVIIGFNLKFDLHWLRRYNAVPEHNAIWDCQIVEYVKSRQRQSYPSLDQAGESYGLGQKIDIVAKEYWDKGIDTDHIPREILEDYLARDLELTEEVYYRQLEWFQQQDPATQSLIRLMFQDLIVLEEMERNGLYYDFERSDQRATELEAEREKLEADLVRLSGYDFLNWNSNRHLSCLLFGGPVKVDVQEEYDFHYADGRTAKKKRWIEQVHQLPPLATPFRGTELQPGKDGTAYYKTDEAVLRKLRVNAHTRRLIDTLLEKKKVEKKISTYYRGIPALAQEMLWDDGCIHGSLNQCVTTTGRLASAKPNQQNFPDDFRQCIVTRYGKQNGIKRAASGSSQEDS